MVAAFVTVTEYRGDTAMAGGYPAFMQALLATQDSGGIDCAWAIHTCCGAFRAVAAFATTYSPSVTSELSAVKALFGEMKLTGHLPVTIPGVAKFGDGIQLPGKQ